MYFDDLNNLKRESRKNGYLYDQDDSLEDIANMLAHLCDEVHALNISCWYEGGAGST